MTYVARKVSVNRKRGVGARERMTLHPERMEKDCPALEDATRAAIRRAVMEGKC